MRGDTGRGYKRTQEAVILDLQVGDDFPEVSSKLKSGKRNRNCSVVSNYFLVRRVSQWRKNEGQNILHTEKNLVTESKESYKQNIKLALVPFFSGKCEDILHICSYLSQHLSILL